MIILILNSCLMFKENGIEVKVINDSSEPIVDVEFTTSEKVKVIKIDQIKPNEIKTEFLSMQKNKSDGNYILTFTRTNGKRELIKGGYYTNGGSLDNWVDFVVKNDTTIVKFDGPIY